jgi:hypothetical protein
MKHAWTVLCPVCDEGKLSSRSLSNERERETDLRRDLHIGRVREPVVRQGHGSGQRRGGGSQGKEEAGEHEEDEQSLLPRGVLHHHQAWEAETIAVVSCCAVQ